jgi:hypothetical protein
LNISVKPLRSREFLSEINMLRQELVDMENPGRKRVTDSLLDQAFTLGEYPRFSEKVPALSELAKNEKSVDSARSYLFTQKPYVFFDTLLVVKNC